MTSSVYLSRQEELVLDRLAGVNGLKRNEVLRLGLRELAARADATGRLPIVPRRGDASARAERDASPVDVADT